MIIAFSGVSGSGKTTLINKLKKTQVFKGYIVYFKEEDQFVGMNLIKKILGENVFNEYKKEKFYKKKTDQFQTKIFGFISGFFYPLLVYFDFFCDYFYYEILFHDKILVRDRYIYDYWVTNNKILGYRNVLFNFLFESFPRPFLLFYVQISISEAIRRNKNKLSNMITISDSFHKNVVNGYEIIYIKKKIIRLNGEDKIENIFAAVTNNIKTKIKFTKIKTISISGLDGSGKSTLSKNLKNYLEKLGYKVKIVHFYHENIIYKVIKRTGLLDRKLNNWTYDKSRKKSIEIKKKGKSFVWAFMSYVDSYVQYVIYRLVYFNQVIVFDRFFYDYVVSFRYLKINRSEFLFNFIPKIDEKFLLNVSPTVAYKRKPENVFNFFDTSAREYLRMAKIYNLKIINAGHKKESNLLTELLRLL